MVNKTLDELKEKVENFNGIIYGMIPIHVVIEMIEKAKVKYPETENEEELKAYLQNKDKETIIELYLQKEFDHKVELETVKYLKSIKRYDIGEMLIENAQLKKQLAESKKNETIHQQTT